MSAKRIKLLTSGPFLPFLSRSAASGLRPAHPSAQRQALGRTDWNVLHFGVRYLEIVSFDVSRKHPQIYLQRSHDLVDNLYSQFISIVRVCV